MSLDPHKLRKLTNLKRNLWGMLALGFVFCAIPAIDILSKGYVGGGSRGSGHVVRRSDRPLQFYLTFGATQIPGLAIIIWSVRSYRRRQRTDV